MRPHAEIGRWRLRRRLGGGGNGEVWSCSDSAGYEGALKLLRRERRSRDRIARFRREISFLTAQRTRQGILPIIDYALPEDPADITWYVMPLAQPLRTVLGNDPPISTVVECVAEFARTLADLAQNKVAHRDIKPDNLFRLGEEWVIGDFGLVTYPDRDPITRSGRRVGPTDYLAPEMRDSPDTSDAELADVYSLAKTLWVLLSGNDLPLPGQHKADEDFARLTVRLQHAWAAHLDLLIERCTANDPLKRPKMREVHLELSALLSSSSDQPNETPDLQELEHRISTLTERHRRLRIEYEDTVRNIVLASEQLRETAAQPAFSEIMKHLPSFFNRVPVEITIPQSLSNGRVPPVHQDTWAAMLAAPPGVGVWAKLGYVIQAKDMLGAADLFVTVEANRHNSGKGRSVFLLERRYETRVPSASYDLLLNEVRGLYFSAIPKLLKLIAEMVEAELRTSS